MVRERLPARARLVLIVTFSRTFKALTALVILHVQQGNIAEMVSRYRELLACIGASRVTSNSIMDAITRLVFPPPVSPSLPLICCAPIVASWTS
jgi:hypothetical protein